MIGKDTSRTTISLPKVTKEAIEALAHEKGCSFSTATQHLITIGLTQEAIALGGGEVFARLPNGEQRVLADKSGNYTHRTPFTRR